MEESKKKKGGRRKGTPNKPKPVKVLARIVEDYTEYFNNQQGAGVYVNKSAELLNGYSLACIALEMVKAAQVQEKAADASQPAPGGKAGTFGSMAERRAEIMELKKGRKG